MMEVIPLSQSQYWNQLVCSMPEYDFYFLNEYHQLDNFGTPLLLHYKDAETTILFPVVVREIEGTSYKDITSVYGYPGPLVSRDSVTNETKKTFQRELLTFFDQENIVSVFSRLNPFLHQGEVLSGLGEINYSNDTVYIDLSQSREDIEAGYSQTLRYDLKSLQKNNLELIEVVDKQDVLEFVAVYYENMKRVQASEYYYFSCEYFLKLWSLDCMGLMVAKKDGRIIGGTLYSICNRFLQVHLSATKTDYLDLSPTKLIWNKFVDVGQSLGKKYLHLGGGYGGMQDTLSRFKLFFSKKQIPFNTWRYIHKKEEYERLLEQKNIDKTKENTYFPLYRSKNN